MRPYRRHGSHVVALEAGAGLALACFYGSSDEYEADVLRSRFGRAHRRPAYAAFVSALAAFIVVLFVL